MSDLSLDASLQVQDANLRQTAARYGFSWGMQSDPDFAYFFCPEHMGWGPGLNYDPNGFEAQEKPDNFCWVIVEPLNYALYDLGSDQPGWVDETQQVTGLEPLDAVAARIVAAGGTTQLTAWTVILYQIRKHFFTGQNEPLTDTQAITAMFETAYAVANDNVLTPYQKIDFMRRKGDLVALQQAMDGQVPYSLAAEMFPPQGSI